MKEIELYKAIRFIKDFDSDSSSPVHVRKGTGGVVVEIIDDEKKNERVYLVELFAEDYGEEGRLVVSRRDQIERAEEWD